jgi:hypothetical protein
VVLSSDMRSEHAAGSSTLRSTVFSPGGKTRSASELVAIVSTVVAMLNLRSVGVRYLVVRVQGCVILPGWSMILRRRFVML